MAKADEYGLRKLIGNRRLNRQQQKTRFERTRKAMTDWRESGGKGALGDFYEWMFADDDPPGGEAR